MAYNIFRRPLLKYFSCITHLDPSLFQESCLLWESMQILRGAASRLEPKLKPKRVLPLVLAGLNLHQSEHHMKSHVSTPPTGCNRSFWLQ